MFHSSIELSKDNYKKELAALIKNHNVDAAVVKVVENSVQFLLEKKSAIPLYASTNTVRAFFNEHTSFTMALNHVEFDVKKMQASQQCMSFQGVVNGMMPTKSIIYPGVGQRVLHCQYNNEEMSLAQMMQIVESSAVFNDVIKRQDKYLENLKPSLSWKEAKELIQKKYPNKDDIVKGKDAMGLCVKGYIAQTHHLGLSLRSDNTFVPFINYFTEEIRSGKEAMMKSVDADKTIPMRITLTFGSSSFAVTPSPKVRRIAKKADVVVDEDDEDEDEDEDEEKEVDKTPIAKASTANVKPSAVKSVKVTAPILSPRQAATSALLLLKNSTNINTGKEETHLNGKDVVVQNNNNDNSDDIVKTDTRISNVPGYAQLLFKECDIQMLKANDGSSGQEQLYEACKKIVRLGAIMCGKSVEEYLELPKEARNTEILAVVKAAIDVVVEAERQEKEAEAMERGKEKAKKAKLEALAELKRQYEQAAKEVEELDEDVNPQKKIKLS